MIYPDNWYKVNPYQKNDKGKYAFDQATRYAIRIIQKEVPAPTNIVKVVERHLDDLSKSQKPNSGIRI